MRNEHGGRGDARLEISSPNRATRILLQRRSSGCAFGAGGRLVGGADDEARPARTTRREIIQKRPKPAVAPQHPEAVSTCGGGERTGTAADHLGHEHLRDLAHRGCYCRVCETRRGEREDEARRAAARERAAVPGGGISRRGDGSLNERTNGTDGPRAPGWTIGRARGGSTRARGSGAGDEARRTRE